MKRVLAIARLAFWEGIRMRIVLVFVVVLIFAVLRLPFALRGDETLAGRLQTFLAYSLGALSMFLSLATVFLSCATLSRELKSRSLHMVVTKPVSRFEILAGKWLGVNALNLLLVLLCGAAIYGFAVFIKTRPEKFTRDRIKIEDVVWTARSAASPTVPDFTELATANVEKRIAEGTLPLEKKGRAIVEQKSELETQWRSIQPGTFNVYEFDGLLPPERENAAIQLRFRARGIPPPPNEMLRILWEFRDPETGRPLMPPFQTEKRGGDLHQFLVKAEPVISNGRAMLAVYNPATPASRLVTYFEGEESLQILYKVGSFESNFVAALLMILLRLSFLSAVGLFFSTFVSFAIACLCTFATFILGLGWNWWWNAIGAELTLRTDSIDPYGRWGPLVRFFLEPLLYVFPNFSRFNGTPPLVDGQFIPYTLLTQCAAQTLGFGGALLLILGWLIFRRREIAEVTV